MVPIWSEAVPRVIRQEPRTSLNLDISWRHLFHDDLEKAVLREGPLVLDNVSVFELEMAWGLA